VTFVDGRTVETRPTLSHEIRDERGIIRRRMRVDQPLPGDQVIRTAQDSSGVRATRVVIITHWPDSETIVGGPYQSFGYALRMARDNVRDRSEKIWRDYARPGEAEKLEQVLDEASS
jgi:hypothetical protein